MARQKIRDRLERVFRDVFDDESISISDSTTAADIEGWDSLEHISLIVAVESEFGFRFAMSEATGMRNVGEMLDIIEARTRD